MVFVLGDDIDEEIRGAFSKDAHIILNDEEEIRSRFKEHKNLLTRHLNRKCNVSFLESYVQHKIIPRGLRDKVVPVEHLHNDYFLEKWKTLCIKHGLAVMQLITGIPHF